MIAIRSYRIIIGFKIMTLYFTRPPALIVLRFDLATPNLWTEVFFLTSNTSKNWLIGFLALIFLTVTDGSGETVLLSVNSLGLYTTSASIMALYFCQSFHFTTYLYNFLDKFIHLCSYKSLLINYWYNQMVTIYCLNCYGFNKPLILTRWCSND